MCYVAALCKTIFQMIICVANMILRLVMTTFIMIENLVRLLLRNIYECLSFILQIFSILPVCCVFLLTAKLHCFLCSSGGFCRSRTACGDTIFCVVLLATLFYLYTTNAGGFASWLSRCVKKFDCSLEPKPEQVKHKTSRMCRTIQSMIQAFVCSTQMIIRIFMTFMLMIENLVRMLMQTFYNFVSFTMQILSLAPICLVFILSSRLKCFMCGGGGPCPINRGGTCDCIMSGVAVVIIFLIFRATGVLDKIFYSLGYAKAQPIIYTRLLPTPGSITECSRNDTVITDTTTELSTITDFVYVSDYWYMTSSTQSSTPIPEIIFVSPTSSSTTTTRTWIHLANATTTRKKAGREGDMEEVTEGGVTPSNVVYYLM